MTAYETVLTLRDYLNIYPDGNVMAKFRKHQKWYPFGMDTWSEDKCRSYLKQASAFILKAFENPSQNDNMIDVDEIRAMVSGLDVL